MPFRSIEVDLDTGIVDIELGDGRTGRGELGDNSWRRESAIRHFRLDFAAGQLVLCLPNGHDALVELCMPDRSGAELLADRIIVYLDQNLWSQLARARHGAPDMDADETSAAATLARLVDERQIVLPVSAGHFHETGRHLGPNRDPIASTLLEVSRGWQMRHPGVVGLRELTAAVYGAQRPMRTDVFTLEPNATFLTPFPPPETPYPEPLGSIMSHVIAASGTYDAIVEGPIPDEGGKAAKQAWAKAQDDLVKMLNDDKAAPDVVGRAALGRLLLDYADQGLKQPESTIDLDAFKSWLPTASDQVFTMPYLGRLWRVTYARLRNGSPWKGNDLVDIHNLCAAAGYADVVAGEKRTISDLRAAKSVTSGAHLATSLVGAVAAIEQLAAAEVPATVG